MRSRKALQVVAFMSCANEWAIAKEIYVNKINSIVNNRKYTPSSLMNEKC